MFSKLPQFRRAEDKRFLKEWIVLGLFSLALALALGCTGATKSLDHLFYDWWLQQLPRSTNPDIVVVEIDNESIRQLGRWPWNRQAHASVLERISAANPRGIIYDILFTEPSADDDALAHAMAMAPVYLPMIVETARSTEVLGQAALPVEKLRNAAAGVGHINLEADRDGIVRGVSLSQGNSQRMWPQLTLPMYWTDRGTANRFPASALLTDAPRGDDNNVGFKRTPHILIPFANQSQPFHHVSFVDVLEGNVPPAVFRNKFVLVGVTADGVHEHLTTAVSSRKGSMPGIEVHANILNALLDGGFIRAAGPCLAGAWAVLPLLLLFAGFLFLTPRQSIILMPSLALAAFVASGLLIHDCGWWISPAPAILVLIVVYPLWGWRRLEVAMSFIGAELERLAQEPQLVQDRRSRGKSTAGHGLERNIALMREAAQQVRDMRRFIWDSLNSLPDPVLVADPSGKIVLVNNPAYRYLLPLTMGSLEGKTFQELLSRLTFVRTVGNEASIDIPSPLHWAQLLDPTVPANKAVLSQGVEVRDANGHHFVLRYSRCTNTKGDLIGWIANLADVTNLHAAQSQRDEMLHLLSHDMRSPHASIVALIKIERPRAPTAGLRLAFDRIERYARRALALADSFVQLAAAETREYVLEELDLADLLHSAVDELWPLANAKQINIRCELGAGEYVVLVEPSMIARALVNLLNNAIKYSPPNTHIDCTMRIAGDSLEEVECIIRDHGYGIAEEQKARLFKRFQRIKVAGQPDSDGVGLGLTFVKAVVTRHGGTICCESAPGAGTAMIIRLPRQHVPETGMLSNVGSHAG